MTLEEHRARFANRKPHLRARMKLYPKGQGPRREPILPGWTVACSIEKKLNPDVTDGTPILLDGPLAPGEHRDVDFFFLWGRKAVLQLTQKPLFYLWEGGYIGEAITLKIYD